MPDPSDAIQQGSLFVRPKIGAGGHIYWDAQWRFRSGKDQAWRQTTRRLGLAWQEADGTGGWRKRRGRCPEGYLDERAADVAAVAAMERHVYELLAADRVMRERAEEKLTVRELARDWLSWLEQVRGAKPSTIRDYGALLREPGQKFRNGKGESAGRIMKAFGDKRLDRVSTRDVSSFLRELDAAGLTPRNVNKYRQVLQAMFSYACRADTFDLAVNPVEKTDKRREPPLAALDYYEVEEVEALARACLVGSHRRTSAVTDDEKRAREAEDRQDADAFRVLFYTGIRVGELLTLRWADVDLASRSLLVRRNLSANVETDPKGRRHRYVPLADPALEALARLGSRDDFLGADDYVVCNRVGRRLDPSALRRRYYVACETAGLRRVKLHGLRHAAGSILARTADPVFVRDYLGHSKLSTTDRYVGAKHRPEDFDRLNRAFGSVQGPDVTERVGEREHNTPVVS
ncbi:MAG: tyrosine-type recombinase/integrase [Acidobacteriota bacterium]|nr:tyrosine-type recombinase/integrase [Acidobacteriota bacterium]